MGADFQTLWGEVKQTFPNLSPFLAKRFIQRAVNDIYDAKSWSFLQDEGVLYSPAVIQAGSFSITQFSFQIVADATARTALNGLSNPILTKRQIKFGTELYNISSVDVDFATNGILLLDRPVLEETNISQSYLCYRAYYSGPMTGQSATETTDFKRYESIYYPAVASWFRIIPGPRPILNRRDPQRAAAGISYYLYTYKASSDGTQQFEMWPHPLNSAYYLCSYFRRGIEPSLPTDTLPLILEDELVLARANYHGCLWAHKNMSRYNELKGINWLNIAREYLKSYSNVSSADPGLLEQAIIKDEEINPQQIVIDERSYSRYRFGTDERTGFSFINPSTGQSG